MSLSVLFTSPTNVIQTTLDIWAYAMTHSDRNFTAPEEFIPERWDAENPRFPEDRREASQPFSLGPRNCIGKKYVFFTAGPSITSPS